MATVYCTTTKPNVMQMMALIIKIMKMNKEQLSQDEA